MPKLNIYKYNPFTAKYYTYPLDIYNSTSNFFDETLHNNNLDPPFLPTLQCAYCGYIFPSRNRLFHHLNFMGINTTRSQTKTDYYDIEKGDMGIEKVTRKSYYNKRNKNKNNKYSKLLNKIHKRYSIRQRQIPTLETLFATKLNLQ